MLSATQQYIKLRILPSKVNIRQCPEISLDKLSESQIIGGFMLNKKLQGEE